MTRRIYVLYLLNCLHMATTRPGYKAVWCPECKQWQEAIELRKCT